MSYREYRFKTNPLEERFARIWEEQNKQEHIVEYMLSDIPNIREHVDDGTQDKIAGMMQWLGSPVGQYFLSKALGFDVNKHIPTSIKEKYDPNDAGDFE